MVEQGHIRRVCLFTAKKMKDDYFDTNEDAVSLNQTGKPVAVEAMNKHPTP